MSQTSQSSPVAASEFDFSAAGQSLQSASLQSYVQKREYETRRVLEKRPTKAGSGHIWALVFVLMSSLIGLSVYSVTLIQQQQQQIAAFEQEKIAEVAGAREDLEAKNVVTAEGFSLVFNNQSPQGFENSSTKMPSKFVEGQEAVVTSYQFAKISNGEQFLSGISTEVVQFDNKLSREDFSAKVAKIMGDSYTVSSESLTVAKNIVLTKINGNKPGVDVYTAVTADNYYVITLFTQTKSIPGLDEVNNFTDTMLTSLYLN